MQRNTIIRLGWALVIALGLVAASFCYWQVLVSERIAADARNPRYAARGLNVARGGIYDRNGEVIAHSQGPGTSRQYVQMPSLGPTIGYMSKRYGLAGLEAGYNWELSGGNQGKTLAGWWKTAALGQIVEGYELTTTLDLRLQRVAERALAGKKGAVVALQPQTGEILVLASSPGFVSGNVDVTWSALVEDASSPLLNRPVMGLYPPGSAFKPLILASALESGVIGFGDVFEDAGSIVVDGHRIENAGGKAYGTLDLASALAVSSNVVFVQIGQKLGEENLRSYARQFGIGMDVQLGIPHKTGRLASRSMSKTELAEESMGQGQLLVTPLEMALLVSCIANGGGLPEPILVKAIRDQAGNLLQFHRPRLLEHPISRRTAAFVRDAMVQVVEWGTGTRAAIPAVPVAGKTGTAENPHGRSHGWFIGFAPAYKPEIAIAVVVENGGSGGVVAAPIARQVIEAAVGVN